jgi:hypothetical protein
LPTETALFTVYRKDAAVKNTHRFNRLLVMPGVLVLALALAQSLPAAANTGAPQLKLFPRDVTEMLKETGETARAMESSLKGVIAHFESQTALFNQSGCSAGSEDPGCVELSGQIAQNYQKMLDIMQENLPQMKRTINATSKGLAARLRTQLGKNATPAQLQNTLGPQSQPVVAQGRFSLSKRFEQYYRLISSNQQSLATLASEIYLDASSVSEWIDLMEAEIGRQQTIIELGRLYGSVTPEMVRMVDNVKSIVFGEEETRGSVPAGPQPEHAVFKSNLEY